MTVRAAIDNVRHWLRKLRQLLCIHGPIEQKFYPQGYPGAPYAMDECKRCGKITRLYHWI